MFLSSEILTGVYQSLGLIDPEGSGKVARERTSALRYFLAALELLKRLDVTEVDLGTAQTQNRSMFTDFVGNVVQIDGGPSYTNNFREEIEFRNGFGVGNNFLTSALKRNGDYPGRPAPLLIRNNETLRIHPNAFTNLHQYGSWDQYKKALGIWLVRNEDFVENSSSSTASKIYSSIQETYGVELANNLFENIGELEEYVNTFSLVLSAEKPVQESILNNLFDQQPPINISDIIGSNQIIYGAPGTGKSFFLDQFKPNIRTVFHFDYQNSDFLGAYKPYVANGAITYQFVPGPFVKAFIHALDNPDSHSYLIIEELNRANASAVFGEVFLLLDRNDNGESTYTVDPEQSLQDFISSKLNDNQLWKGKLFLPKNLSIYASMNSSDQGVELLDSAFKRRWIFKYLPINFDILPENDIRRNEIIPYVDQNVSWIQLAQGINKILSNSGLPEDRLLGQFFLSSSELSTEDSIMENVSGKLFIYLWDDVLRHGQRNLIFDVTQHSSFNEIVESYKQGDRIFSDQLNAMLLK